MILRTLPLRLELGDGESLDSRIEALARRYRTSPRRMLGQLGLGRDSDYVGTVITKLNAAAWTSAEQAARLAPGVLRAAAGGEYSAVSVLRSGGSRFCPRCLGETGGRWLLRWRLNWSVACLRHRLLLAERCPACASPQRSRFPGGHTPIDPATCAHSGNARGRCGADLTLARTARADDGQIEVERWIEGQLELLRGSDSQQAEQIFADLPVVTSWLARRAVPDDVARGRRGYGKIPAADAGETAGFLAVARILLTGADEEAIAALQQLATTFPANNYRLPPPGMGHRRWRALGPVFPNRYLRAVDSVLQSGDRLRTKSVISTAARIDEAPSGRAGKLPQLLWPEWTARLLPRTGLRTDKFRAVMSTSVLLPGSPGRNHTKIAAQLNPHLPANSITTGMQGIADIDGEASLRPVLIAICHIADYLDQHGSTIDYERRRQVTAVPAITWERWRDLACSAGTHPGDRIPTGRLLHAQRHLHQLLSGSDLADPAHPLAFHGSDDRARYLEFTAGLTSALRGAFHEHAEQFLAAHGIDEPVTWHPPLQLADGLELPGIDLDQIDLELIKRVVIDERRAPRTAAKQLGVHVEHVRIALERLDRPDRTWTYRGVPEAWKREQVLTREYFEREYLGARRSLRQIGEELGVTRGVISRQARRHGVETDQVARKTIALDEIWLRQQYIQRQRSTSAIAEDAGVTQMTVARALERLGVPLRPSGVASHPQMLVKLDGRLPRDIRAAVEGSLHGWKRLRRFQIAMALPSLNEVERHLGLPKSGLVAQLQRLESDLGEALFTRSAPGRAQAPTQRGKKLLRALDRPHIKALMSEAHGPAMEPMPEQAGIRAATERFNLPPRNPGPLKPFDGIAVARTRITAPTLRLLQDLLEHGDPHTYGHEVSARTRIDAGTLYPALHRLQAAGWLTSWPEPEQEWLAGAPPGRGPGRRRIYYAFTPEGRRAAEHEIEHRTEASAR